MIPYGQLCDLASLCHAVSKPGPLPSDRDTADQLHNVNHGSHALRESALRCVYTVGIGRGLWLLVNRRTHDGIAFHIVRKFHLHANRYQTWMLLLSDVNNSRG